MVNLVVMFNVAFKLNSVVSRNATPELANTALGKKKFLLLVVRRWNILCHVHFEKSICVDVSLVFFLLGFIIQRAHLSCS